ncbi:MBL fold metallo-hydrolase [Pectinatus brassicae]|uniref:Glyoxylase-like metal-dependent hydrolase (Beta-lactamase superfamily II) n=1 Tax=Pectinatus brassicae TaxID=862415 RepID=A0A840UC90_9FIRM|nr:MBL fold metallo-hydrolase [Pectinatus brassicae]MBB5335351.1 glyoxylase-like metal-dependent hydrolase (beta-lactamase superfamily II) [Pectinatus brassicae]
MRVKTLANGPLEENCYLAIDETSNEAIVIDPGSEPQKIIEWIKNTNITVKYVINTHGHSDHIGANTAVCQEFSVKLGIHELDAPMLTDAKLNLSAFMGIEILSQKADFTLKENDKIQVGQSEFTVIHTPGHSPGGICLVSGDTMFSGDSLFAQSIGRTDFPGGSMEDLVGSLQSKVLVLDEKTKVYPGHGPATTIGYEKQYNPYF